MITLRLVFGTMICLIIFAGCRKQIDATPAKSLEPFVSVALEHLRQHLPESEFRMISTDNYVYLDKSSSGLDLVRFFVKGDAARSITVSLDGGKISSSWLSMKDQKISAPDNQFLISGIAEDRSQEIKLADGHLAEVVSAAKGERSIINIRQVDNRQVISRMLSNGKVDPESSLQWLPEFTVIANIGGVQTTFYSLYWLTNMNPAYFFAYSNIDPYQPIDVGGAVGVPVAPSLGEEIYLIESFEYENLPAVKLDKIIKCFDGIPNAGATYSMTMYVDIPNNDDPTQLTENLSPGHTFLAMTKSNGQYSITQVFGFYPAVGTLSMFGTAVKSKIRDNSEHEYDASFTINDVDIYSFNSAVYLAQYYANGMHYDINDFNCTDFALDIFNKARPIDNQITVSDWILNGVGINCGTTPNGLYYKLASEKASNTQDSDNIQIGTSTAPTAKGECN